MDSPVTSIPLIGAKYTTLLKKLGVNTVEDFLHHYPARYEDRRLIKKIAELTSGEAATLRVEVEDIKNTRTKYGKTLTQAAVADESGQLQVVWFNQPFITNNIKAGTSLSLFGKLGWFGRQPALISPEYEFTATHTPSPHTGRIVPIYPETRGVSSKWIRSRMNAIRESVLVGDWLPEEIRKQESLIGLEKAIRQIHFPDTWENLNTAKARLAFDEIFLLQLKSHLGKKKWSANKTAPVFKNCNEEEFIKQLPFELTLAQKRCFQEILKDLSKPTPMNRLLEGDVGSGKTIVAAIAAFRALQNNFNVLYMAPTEVLAEQQYNSLRNYFSPYEIEVELLTGSRKQGNKRRGGVPPPAMGRILTLQHGSGNPTPTNPFSLKETGEQGNLVVGTHALLFKPDGFGKVGLVIVDEQHRFGVKQRSQLLKLKSNQLHPHFLTMTATPIPRSLALTIYSHLDLSTLDEMPPGRKPVKTWVVAGQKRPAAYEWIQNQIQTNHTQAFIVCPFIEKSAHEELESVKAATEEFKRLKTEVFPHLNLALLHGKTKSQEKEAILTDFREGKYQILVATPVVEVGLDIPQATIMLIEGAERFGLASLHQLRGRVGRGGQQAYCLLFSETKTTRRLKAMEQYQNGLKLAEIDLKLRGPGDFYGTQQHGFLKLKLASLTDTQLTHQTKQAVDKVVGEGIGKYPQLQAYLDRGEVSEPE